MKPTTSLTYAAGLPKKASGNNLLNVPQLFDNFNPKIRQIVESFSTFDYLGSNWYQIVESAAPIRQI